MTAPDKSKPPKNTPKSVQDYHIELAEDHLDQRFRCREHPLDPCPTGYALLKKAVRGLIGDDVFEKIKVEQPERK